MSYEASWNSLHIGTETIEAASTRPTLTIDQLKYDIGDIARGLQANAIRITDGDIRRMASAGQVAARQGLEVWLSPMVPTADQSTTLSCIAEAARVAEDLRQGRRTAVLVIGCELSVFMSGILPGATHAERFAVLADPNRLVGAVTAAGIDPQAVFTAFLHTALEMARSMFHGQVACASGAWEEVNWSRFDFVGVDAYRDASNREG